MSNEQVEILLVEDDPADLELTLRALKDEHAGGRRIQVARDGEEALDFLFCRAQPDVREGQSNPKLVLLDLKIPKVNGLEVLDQIKSNARTHSIPVVILTSSKQERDVIQGYRLGANSYIQKPMDYDHFRTTLNQVAHYWLQINQPPIASL